MLINVTIILTKNVSFLKIIKFKSKTLKKSEKNIFIFSRIFFGQKIGQHVSFSMKICFFQGFLVFLRSQYHDRNVFTTLEEPDKVENGSKQPKIGQSSWFQAKIQNPAGASCCFDKNSYFFWFFRLFMYK